MEPSRSRHSSSASGRKKSRYLCLGAFLELVNIYLDRLGLVSHASEDFSVQILVRQLFHERFEQRRLNHVKGSSVVIQNGHGPIVRTPQHRRRVPLELGHAHRDVCENSFHFGSKFRAQYSYKLAHCQSALIKSQDCLMRPRPAKTML